MVAYYVTTEYCSDIVRAKAVFQLAPQDPGVKQAKPGGPSAEGASFERHRREDLGAEGVGCGERVSPSPQYQKIFRFLSSKRRPLVHSGCYFCS